MRSPQSMFGTRNFTTRAVSFLNVRFVCITNEAEQYDLLHTAEIMSSTLKSDCQLLIAEEAAPSIWHEHSEMWTVCWIAVNKPSLFRTSCCHSFYLTTCKPESSHSFSLQRKLSLSPGTKGGERDRAKTNGREGVGDGKKKQEVRGRDWERKTLHIC